MWSRVSESENASKILQLLNSVILLRTELESNTTSSVPRFAHPDFAGGGISSNANRNLPTVSAAADCTWICPPQVLLAEESILMQVGTCRTVSAAPTVPEYARPGYLLVEESILMQVGTCQLWVDAAQVLLAEESIFMQVGTCRLWVMPAQVLLAEESILMQIGICQL